MSAQARRSPGLPVSSDQAPRMRVRYQDNAQHTSSRPGDQRHPRWRSVRRHHLRMHGSCAACGSTRHLEVHHIIPRTVDPARELDPSNLMTLCTGDRGKGGCHLVIGHRGRWEAWEPDAVILAAQHLARLRRAGDLRGHGPH